MLIEIHMLQNHAPSNLNRDEDGSPKESLFGNVKRARISSQCLKRSIRRSELFTNSLDDHLATRTRRMPELVRKRVLNEMGNEELADIAAQKATGFGTKEGKERKIERGRYNTAQTMFLSDRDIDIVTETLLEAIEEADKDPKKLEKTSAKDLQAKAAKAGYRPVTVDIALFGRMTTSDAFHDVQASTQVAHALATHKSQTQFDYYTAVDDLLGTSEQEEDPGADMIGEVEYVSACYYKYFSIDVDALVNNLTGSALGRKEKPSEAEVKQARELAGQAVRSFVEAAAKVTPTGKQNSFAAHNLPSAILVEVRPHKVPVSYANAFVEPAHQTRNKDLVASSLEKFKEHVEAVTSDFNLEADPRLFFVSGYEDITIAGTKPVADLNELAETLQRQISEAEASHA